ncbi:O-antigen polymerase [Aerococcus loyolae]|uniref:O-antigen polymerase n=2 Tax=Aerococcus loyolae TaxID=2976809 RepID=UPI00227D164A|nr:O-antigen polymerase [Aerococcus loyolae]MCY3027879.1 oligosaccharide repeat unit polymerase [Aerococcus loyolae]
MFFKLRKHFSLLLYAIFILYMLISPLNPSFNIINAFLSFFLSILFILKFKSDKLLFIMGIFISYCIYSIFVGEFLFPELLTVPMNQVKTVEIYGTTINTLLIFITTILIFVNKNKKKAINNKKNETVYNSPIIQLIFFIALMLIGIFGVNRTRADFYNVQISSLYEYSYLFFIILYFFTNSRVIRYLINFLLILFILQDYYYGGRITSLQLFIVFFYFNMIQKIKTKNIFSFAILGIFINSLVGAYRINYSLTSESIIKIFKKMINNMFVFDTSTYSFYASATHVAAVNYGNINLEYRIDSLFKFIKSIFFGGSNDIGNVTRFVSDHYFQNIGGGIFPSHFYFWLGILGVVLGSFVVVLMMNKFRRKDNIYFNLAYLVLIVSSPRWFLYNPLILFRSQFLFFILFSFSLLIRGLFVKRINKKRSGKEEFS